MRRSWKFLLRPTARQTAGLAACLEDHRQLYNAALEHRRTAYAKAGVSVRYGDQSAELKHIRADDAGGQGRWSFSSQQATLRRLDKAFAAFFKRVREGRDAGLPPVQGPRLVRHGRVAEGRRRLPLGLPAAAPDRHLRAAPGRRARAGPPAPPVSGTVKTISVKREGSRWFVVLSCDEVSAEPLPATGAIAGIDLGVASLVTTSDGEHLANPRHLAASAERLAAAQRTSPARSAAQAAPQGGRPSRALHGKVRRQRSTARTRPRSPWSALRRDRARRPADREHDPHRVRHGRAARPQRRAEVRPQPEHPGRGLGVFLTILADKAESAGRRADRGEPRQHLPHVRPLRALREGEPRHPGRVRLYGVRTHRARRRERGDQHPQGRACPSPAAKRLSEKPLSPGSGGVTTCSSRTAGRCPDLCP